MAKIANVFVELRAKFDRLRVDLDQAGKLIKDRARVLGQTFVRGVQGTREAIGLRAAGGVVNFAAITATLLSVNRLIDSINRAVNSMNSLSRALSGTTRDVNVTAERFRFLARGIGQAFGGAATGDLGGLGRGLRTGLLAGLPAEDIRAFFEAQQGLSAEQRREFAGRISGGFEAFGKDIEQQLKLIRAGSEVQRVIILFQQAQDDLIKRIEELRIQAFVKPASFAKIVTDALQLLEEQFAPLLADAQAIDQRRNRVGGVISTIETATGPFKVGQTVQQNQLTVQRRIFDAVDQLRRNYARLAEQMVKELIKLNQEGNIDLEPAPFSP